MKALFLIPVWSSCAFHSIHLLTFEIAIYSHLLMALEIRSSLLAPLLTEKITFCFD